MTDELTGVLVAIWAVLTPEDVARADARLTGKLVSVDSGAWVGFCEYVAPGGWAGVRDDSGRLDEYQVTRVRVLC